MDEPTNDLDMETLELLEERLLEYPGTLLLVSHDRAFLDNVVTATLVLEGLLWAVLWGFAPREIANPAGIAIIATSAVATMSYTVWRHRKSRLSGRE
jgi:ATPase subunit of ABC transporter with duplicated ATPase domains